MIYFEWDPLKAESNVRKHGVSFEDLWMRSSILQLFDAKSGRNGEQRLQRIGMVKGVLPLFIAHMVHTSEGKDEVVRVISARKALRKERREYEERSEDRCGWIEIAFRESHGTEGPWDAAFEGSA